jgi:hypothetical protein
MPQVVAQADGSVPLPESVLRQRRLPPDTAWWLDQRDGALILLPRLPDLRKLYVEPSTVCNLTCRTCIRNVWQDPQTPMEMAVFEQLLTQMEAFPHLQRVVFSGLGEPLTHPHFLEMVRLVRERDLAVTIGTNGLLLEKALSRELVRLGVDRLVISLDGVRSETYAGVRGAPLYRVLDNIRGLNEAKTELASREKARMPRPVVGEEWPTGVWGRQAPRAFSLEEAPACGRGSSLTPPWASSSSPCGATSPSWPI